MHPAPCTLPLAHPTKRILDKFVESRTLLLCTLLHNSVLTATWLFWGEGLPPGPSLTVSRRALYKDFDWARQDTVSLGHTPF